MSALADPLLVYFLCGLIGALLRLRFRTLGNIMLVALAGGLYLLSTPLVSSQMLRAQELGGWPDRAVEQATAQAIVVLGADIRHGAAGLEGETVGPLSLERVRHAAALWRQTGLPILVSGGTVGGSERSISEIMAEALEVDFSAPATWIERDSRNTFENARLSVAILRAEDIRSVLVVTHAWHMPRALASFEQNGIHAAPAAIAYTGASPGFSARDLVPTSRALNTSAAALHEWVGRYWYAVAYY